jgi:hypothetical protein
LALWPTNAGSPFGLRVATIAAATAAGTKKKGRDCKGSLPGKATELHIRRWVLLLKQPGTAFEEPFSRLTESDIAQFRS